jgi:hypothetical protein
VPWVDAKANGQPQWVTISATVQAKAGTPIVDKGFVEFSLDGRDQGRVRVSNGEVSITVAVPAHPVSYGIRAEYHSEWEYGFLDSEGNGRLVMH